MNYEIGGHKFLFLNSKKVRKIFLKFLFLRVVFWVGGEFFGKKYLICGKAEIP